MAKIQFDNGPTVDFDGTPTPADVEEVASSLKLKPSEGGDNRGFVTFAQHDADVAQEKPSGLLNRLASSLVGGMVQPTLKLIAHQSQLAQRAQEGLGLSSGTMDPRYARHITIPMPEKLGGNVEVDAPTNGTQAARQLIGEGLQTALLGIPGESLAALGATKSGAWLGGLFGAAKAIESAQTPVHAGIDIGSGILGGTILGKGIQLVGRALTAMPKSLPEAMDLARSIPGKVGFYVYPRPKAANIAEELQSGVSDVQRQMQSLREESGKIGESKKMLQIQRTEKADLGKLATKALNYKWQADIADADKNLTEAISKEVPVLKNQVEKLHGNMTGTYGEILDRAVEGKTFSRKHYQNDVVDPLIEMMDADAVPKDSRIYQTISNLAKADESVTGADAELLTAKEFRHLRDKVMKTVGGGVKSGSSPSTMYNHWANEFTRLQGKFVQAYDPELAAANRAYGRMAFARKQLWKIAKPLTEDDLNGATGLLKRIANDELSPTDKAVIKIAQEGHGPFPGIGKGTIGKGIKSEALTVEQRQKAYDVMAEQLQNKLAIERKSLTKQIESFELRRRQIQTDRADVNKQNESLRILREKKKRLERIAAVQSGIAKAAIVAAGGGAVVGVAHKIKSIQ